MNNNVKQEITDDEIWYIIINEETKGPMSLRDLDVMLRTNEITTKTYGWKNGMKEWKILNDIEEIKDNVLQSWAQIRQIQQSMIDPIIGVSNIQIQNKCQDDEQNNSKDNEIIENKDENPLQILELTVESLLKKSFHQSQDGKWNIYDEKKQQWIIKQQQPQEMIQNMKHHLFNKIKAQLFFEQKNNNNNKRKTTIQQQKIPDQQLTPKQLQKRRKNKKKTRKAIQKKKNKWYNAKINTFIYISGLPFDITQDELKTFCSKAGVLRIDLNSGLEKIKIYKDKQQYPKGDAAVSYARQQSVEIAIQNLNGSEIRNGFKVKVQKAQFNQKDQNYKPRQIKKQQKIKKILAKKNQQKKLTWDQQYDDIEGYKIIILKNIFNLDSIHNNQYLEEVRKEISQELETIGTINRIRFYQSHPQGVVQVKYKQSKDAQKCIEMMDGRYYDERLIQCDYWDGQTNYKKNTISDIYQQKALLSLIEEKVQEQQEQDKIKIKQKQIEIIKQN